MRAPFRKTFSVAAAGVLALALTLSSSTPAVAETSAGVVTVDKILSALAEVLKERGKQVAARVFYRQVTGSLCSGEEIVLGRGDNARRLYLGSARDAKTSDIVFRRTCDLARTFSPSLLDAQFLKLLSQDAVAFLIRVAAHSLEASTYDSFGFPAVAEFVHEVASVSTRNGFSAKDLAAPLLRLTERIPRQIPSLALSQLQAASRARPTLLESLDTIATEWITAGCPHSGTEKACEGTNELAEWYLGDTKSCSAYRRGYQRRQEVFERLYRTADAAGAYPWRKVEDSKCSSLTSQAEVANCRHARLTLGLRDHLVKVACLGEKQIDTAAAVRQFVYIVAQKDLYQDDLEGRSDTATTLVSYLGEASRFDTSTVLYEAITGAVGLAAQYLVSRREASADVDAWLRTFAGDFGKLARSGTSSVFDWPSLESIQATPLPIAVRPLRHQMKYLLALPALLASEGQARVAARERFEAALHDLVRGILALKTDEDLPARVIETLTDLLARLGRASADLGLVAEADVTTLPPNSELIQAKQATAKAMRAMTRVLGAVGELVSLASQREWVGLALRISETLEAEGADATHLQQGLRFIRVLLAAYQSKDVEEAKAIFSAALQDELDRERRFHGLSLDVGALLGFRAGAEIAVKPGEDNATDGFFGFYAPVGIQITKGAIGLLVYPVDVGGYLTTRINEPDADEKKEAEVRVYDALRTGAALLMRPSPTFPIVVAAGADFQGIYEGQSSSWRVMGSLALELPLFTLY